MRKKLAKQKALAEAKKAKADGRPPKKAESSEEEESEDEDNAEKCKE